MLICEKIMQEIQKKWGKLQEKFAKNLRKIVLNIAQIFMLKIVQKLQIIFMRF